MKNTEAIVHCSVRTALLAASMLGYWSTSVGTFNTMCLAYIVFYILWEMFVFSFLCYEIVIGWCFTWLAKRRDPKRPTTKEIKWQTLLQKHKKHTRDNYSGCSDWLEGVEAVELFAMSALFVLLLVYWKFPELATCHVIVGISVYLMRSYLRAKLRYQKPDHVPMVTCPDGESFDSLCDKLFNSRMKEQ